MKSPPERWTTHAANERPDDAEARAGQLLRRAVVKQPLDADALEHVRRRLADAERPPQRRLALSVGIALALFLSGGAVVMSATLLGGWSPFRRAPAAPTTPVAAPAPRRLHAALTPTPPAVTDTFAAPPAPQRARPFHAAAPAAEPADVPEPPPATEPSRPSAIAEEAWLVGAALRRLREQGDAAGALALLDEHDRRFAANGTLADEATTTRVEALLRLGQHARALVLLDAQTLAPTGRGRELLASRGELRGEAGRSAEALADFDAVLADDAATDGAAERALFGRAACRARLGQGDAARLDLEAYVTRFPTGRFAGRVQAALAR
jgi:hypothetical protein